MAKTLFIDTTKCMGCRGCEVACKQWNDLEADIRPYNGSYQTKENFAPQTYTVVNMKELETDDGGVKFLFGKRQCMHCTEASCMMVCPQKAISRTPEGAVVIDREKCIGCGYCVQNCPFDVPQVDQKTKKASKCTLCADRIAEGLVPACVKVCPPGAIQFGEREELLVKAKARLEEIKALFPNAYLYGEKEVKGAALYLVTEKPGVYGLPPEGTQVPWQVKFWKYFARPVGEIALGATALVALAGLYFNYIAKPKPHEASRKEEM